MRVVAALSGGVDSAVAAARLVDAGHDVTGVHLALAEKRYAGGGRGCCTLEDVHDARRAADVLGIPFYVWDFAQRFQETVLDDFLAEYSAGRTPNPCVSCNQHIKFAAVLERAQALGFDAVGTGHYAQLVSGPDGVELHRAVDPDKDQSYVLAVLDQAQLRRSLFPLGDSRKEHVRQEAARRGLLVADKPDSHDICFIPDGDTRGFLRERLGLGDGPIVDTESGRTLGQHSGAAGYTIGQRRGLFLEQPAADGRARYVVDVDVPSNTVFVGPPTRLRVGGLRVDRLRWTAMPVASADVLVQIRAHAQPVPGHLDGDAVVLREELSGVAAGQIAVFYDGTRVLGSGRIASTTPWSERALG
ncbi:MAG: tRNA 2-thiouridine(34) synthase MnmA [Actinobacteria bacterium]|mgnify:CR=1 FL=1|nr:tRNA 2-thiouridine(34) synthase MnmA [Actinomycetota bacterium]MCB8996524.1 tRNA 2-thiouridine(34) synthase MnmA [Actinomycetota bacterium]MCB9415343.1 tRNA 2-thiouridine(34) synthase MnmA [Actinomycetota bacterium]HRY08540.1 tRNA 2-thiouridine(34) synthase MnmA [Candidatus Nanopelagicales bacterium]